MTSVSFMLSPFPSTYPRSSLSNRLSRLQIDSLYQYSHSSDRYRKYSVEHSSIHSHHTSKAWSLLVSAKNPREEGDIAVANLEELDEKDWSFLEADSINSKEEQIRKIDQILTAGNVEDSSKVLVSMASDAFTDRLVDSSPCQQLLVVHESFLTLACIKERHDNIKCWQGDLLSVPKKWAPFDAVFLYFLPALPSKLDETFKALASLCTPGARVVISHLQGREGLEKQRQQHPKNVISDLPNKLTLEKVASNHSFELKEHIDDPSFYLAVLEFKD